MHLNPDDLRVRLEKRSSRELLSIVGSREYTHETRDVALAVLKARPLDEPMEPEAEPSASKQGIGWTILAALVFSPTHFSTMAMRAWQAVEEDRPGWLSHLARALASSSWTYAILAMGALWLWRRQSLTPRP